jgi:PAS domain S-box-containing protein
MSSDVIWVVDAEGRMTFVNQAAKRIYGYEPREMIGRRLTEFQTPERAQQDLKRLKQSEREGVFYQYETQVIRKDGSPVWLSVNGISLYDGQGKFLGATGISRDITERKRTEEILAERENLLKMIFDAEPECVKLISANGALLNMNQAGLMMIEADHLDQVIGKSIYPLIDPKYRQAFVAQAERVFQGESGGLEFELVGLKGTRRWMETHAVPLRNPRGEIVALLGVTRDVTERKRAEEEIKSSREQLRSLSTRLQLMLEEERARIAREVHDELGQLLTVLKMELSWLAHRFYENQAPLQEKVQSMSQLVDTTIETVRKIATELRPGVLDDLGLIAAIEWQAQEFQIRTGVKCKLNVVPESMVLDPARSTAIFRILQEALTNVARHAQANKINIHLARRNGDVVLKVTDNGKGIREDQMSNPKSLGLLGMRERALLWGGGVEIRGMKNRGTTVIVRIPTYQQEGGSS